MAFLQRMSLMITSLINLITIPSTTSISPVQPTMTLIDSICHQTVNASYCEQSIISKLDKPHAELTTIGKIKAFNALYFSKIIYALIRDQYIPLSDTPLRLQEMLKCLRTYNCVGRYLDSANREIYNKQYSEMRSDLSDVLNVLDNCETEFDEMVRQNGSMKLLIDIETLAAKKLPAV